MSETSLDRKNLEKQSEHSETNLPSEFMVSCQKLASYWTIVSASRITLPNLLRRLCGFRLNCSGLVSLQISALHLHDCFECSSLIADFTCLVRSSYNLSASAHRSLQPSGNWGSSPCPAKDPKHPKAGMDRGRNACSSKPLLNCTPPPFIPPPPPLGPMGFAEIGTPFSPAQANPTRTNPGYSSNTTAKVTHQKKAVIVICFLTLETHVSEGSSEKPSGPGSTVCSSKSDSESECSMQPTQIKTE